MAGKGSAFERELSVFLSLWMSNGKSDDLIWRSQTSGARATMRMKKGKTTSGQHSDLSATDSRALPFTETICLEAKRGYTRSGPDEFINRKWQLNKKIGNNLLVMEQFYWQVKAAQEGGGQPYWMIILRKDRRETVVYFPDKLLRDLRNLPLAKDGKSKRCLMPEKMPEPNMSIVAKIRYDPLETRTRRVVIHCMRMEDFFKAVPYKAIKRLHKQHRKGK